MDKAARYPEVSTVYLLDNHMNITVLHMAYCSISVHNELDCDHVRQVFLNQHYAKNERVTIFFYTPSIDIFP